MKFYIITIFPQIKDFFSFSLIGKAIENGIINVECVNPRDFCKDKHKTVDDEPYGGGCGMVMKPEPVVQAIDYVRNKDPDCRVFLLTPRGKLFNQSMAAELSEFNSLAFVCGRYEGIDERVSFFVDGEISLGDFVLSGGEFAACVMIDVISRLVPGVVGKRESVIDESFSNGLLEYPQYTRPRRFREFEVPEVLLSGNHRLINLFRRFERLRLTFEKRPDLLATEAVLSEEDKKWLLEIIKGKRQEHF